MLSFEESVAAISYNVDFASMFDEEQVEDLFRGSDSLFDDLAASASDCGTPYLPLSPMSHDAAVVVVSEDEGSQQTNVPSHNSVVSEDEDATSFACSTSGSNSTTTSPDGNFVNIVMFVDPLSGQVTCPEQILNYKNVGNGRMEKMLFGPTVLDSLPKDMLSLTSLSAAHHQASRQLDGGVSAPVTPTREVMGRAAPAAVQVTPPKKKFAPTMMPVRTTVAGMPPLRALSAYNFYFRDERDRILNGGEHEWTVDKQQVLLAAHWNQDRTKKRRHRKSHGKIDFTSLSRLISSRWKELPDGRKDFYRQVAAQDWERFQRELDEYKKPQAANSPAAPVVLGITNPEAVGSRASPAEESFHTVIG